MDQKRLEQIDYIVNEILINPNVSYESITLAAKLASEDDYLYNLMVDWAKEPEEFWKGQMLAEIIEYTEERLRSANF